MWQLLHEEFSGPLNSDGVLAIFSATPAPVSTTISGIAMGCNNEFLQNGIVMAFQGESSFYHILSGSNQFTMDLRGCVEGPVQLKAFDSSGAQSDVLNYSYAHSIVSDTLFACFDGEENIALIHIPDLNYTVPFRFLSAEVNEGDAIISNFDSTGWRFTLDIERIFTQSKSGAESHISIPFPNSEGLYCEEPQVHIQYFGGPGELITGRGEGIFETSWGSEGNVYPFTFTFSVRRPE